MNESEIVVSSVHHNGVVIQMDETIYFNVMDVMNEACQYRRYGLETV